MGKGGADPQRLKAKVRAVQLNTAGLLKLLGGTDDDKWRFWEILKGITTPVQLRLVENQLDGMRSLVAQAQASAKTIEKTARAISAGG